MNRSINKILEYAAVASIFATLFVPLIVSTSLFFPFISGKANIFRLLVLVATSIYLILVLRDRSYLPRKNVILWATVIFTAVLGLTTLTSIDPVKSFWSNFERMEGYITILHLLAFYIVSASVLRTRAMWATLFSMSLLVSIAVGIQGFLELSEKEGVFGSFRMSGTLGNSSYLGIYALLHSYIAGFFIVSMLKTNKFVEAPGRFIAYGALALFNLLIMYSTGTRGSFAGFVAGLFVITLLIAIFEKNNQLYRKISIWALVVVVGVVALLGSFKNAPFVKNNDLLYRFSSLITFNVSGVLENQGKARTLLWGMAWEGVKERPILGWGQENFSYVFAQHYDPKMHGQEQWFDRTHNVFMDWLIAAGFLGLLSYLGLFGVALYMLWRNRSSESEWTISERAIITGLLTGYFVHNLFVFDNLSSYIIFFLILAYISARHDGRADLAVTTSALEPVLKKQATQYIAIAAIAILLVGGIYIIVWKPYMAGKTLIKALAASSERGVELVGEKDASPQGQLALFKKALSYNTFGDVEINERLAEIAPNNIIKSQDQAVVADFKQTVSNEYEKLLAEKPLDPRITIFYALYFQKIGMSEEALKFIDKSLELSPNKQSFLYQKGIILLVQRRFAEAIPVFKKAYEIEPSSLESKALYGISLIYANNIPELRTLFGDDMAVWSETRVIQALAETNHYDIIVEIGKKRIEAEPNNPQYHLSLASAYIKLKQRANAIAEIQKAIDLAPEFKETGEYYIKEIQAGRDPSGQ